MVAKVIPFKTNVLNLIIAGAKVYNDVFVQYEYEIFSSSFINQKYYIISGEKSNFLHLTGVNTNLRAEEFFNKALNQTLTVNDFDFVKKGQTEKDVKGTVRRKVKYLPFLGDLFINSPVAEENFVKNRISCTLAASENLFTSEK